MILDADRLSQARFSGHGSALAQVYNHIIMPLANRRDRETQILWGIADFERRFGRKPEGMWLAETAVETQTLDLLAQHGIRFTLLAPHQCARIRPLERRKRPRSGAEPLSQFWTETPHASVDTTRSYLIKTSEGRSIAVFFYNGPLSRAIAFEGLLNSGDTYVQRLLGGFRAHTASPQLVHVATDGESYGHHHRHGEMALAYALEGIESRSDRPNEQDAIRLTNYGEFLEMFPPAHQAEINEDTSWSCFHGVQRWRANCGCNGGAAGWHQEWREPLRRALDWLRERIAPLVETAGSELFTDACAARNDFIDVILDRSPASMDRFFLRHAARLLTPPERTRALKLMELERHALLMYTSCGWFFDDVSGIETVQVIAYAARVLALAADIFSLDRTVMEGEFLELLSLAKSNKEQWRDGGVIYRELIQPLEVGLEQVAAHYAISSLFPEDGGPRYKEQALFCYRIQNEREHSLNYGTGQLKLGRFRICSTLSEECERVSFAVLHFGDQNLTAAVKRFVPADEAGLRELEVRARKAIVEGDLPEVVHLLDRFFGTARYSLTSLFSDEQRRVLQRILAPTLDEVERSLTGIYTEHASLLNFLGHTGVPKPPALRIAAQFATNLQLRRAMEEDSIDGERILELMERARTEMVVLDTDTLSFLADARMKRAMLALEQRPHDGAAVEYALRLASTLRSLPFALNLWQAQNIWYSLRKLRTDQAGSPLAYGESFKELGRRLSINVEELAIDEAPAATAATIG
jgi:alpha-amylase/alpha-mannosidase (GH57 family)